MERIENTTGLYRNDGHHHLYDRCSLCGRRTWRLSSEDRSLEAGSFDVATASEECTSCQLAVARSPEVVRWVLDVVAKAIEDSKIQGEDILQEDGGNGARVASLPATIGKPIFAQHAKPGKFYLSADWGKVLCCGSAREDLACAFAYRDASGSTTMKYIHDKHVLEAKHQCWGEDLDLVCGANGHFFQGGQCACGQRTTDDPAKCTVERGDD